MATTHKRAKRETAELMEQQPQPLEPATEQPEQPAVLPATKAPVFSPDEALFLFLACMLLGFVGVLVGFVPLVAIAMAGPIIVAMLA